MILTFFTRPVWKPFWLTTLLSTLSHPAGWILGNCFDLGFQVDRVTSFLKQSRNRTNEKEMDDVFWFSFFVHVFGSSGYWVPSASAPSKPSHSQHQVGWHICIRFLLSKSVRTLEKSCGKQAISWSRRKSGIAGRKDLSTLKLKLKAHFAHFTFAK